MHASQITQRKIQLLERAASVSGHEPGPAATGPDPKALHAKIGVRALAISRSTVHCQPGLRGRSGAR